MIINILMCIGAAIIGHLIKSSKYSTVKILSIGIIIRAIFILCIVLIGENLANWFVLVAVFNGISEVLYWSTHEMIFIGVTNDNNRKNYIAIKKTWSTVVKIIAPIALGSTIELSSFSKIAIYVFVLSIIQVLVTMNIKIDSKKEKTENEKYNLIEYINNLKTNKMLNVISYYKSNLIYGIIENPMKTLVTIITIMTFKTSLNLGILTTIFSICSILMLYLYKKFYNSKNSKYILYTCSFLIFIGAAGLVITFEKTTLFIYNFACTIGLCLFDAIYNTQKGNLIKNSNIEKYDVEHIMTGSIITSLARFLGFSLILVVGLLNNMLLFKALLLVMAILVLIYSKLIYKIEGQMYKG